MLIMIKFSCLPSVFTMEEVSNEASEPASARQDGVWPLLVSVVVNVFSDGPLEMTWPFEAAEFDLRLALPA